MDLVRVTKDNLGTWARQLRDWGFTDVDRQVPRSCRSDAIGMSSCAVRFTGITKRFPGVVALEDVSFDVAAGSCHALCGENGAGKSTLGKILAGIQEPDEGEILARRAHRSASTIRATRWRRASRMVHQELAFCENLSVAENLCLGDLPARGRFVARVRDGAPRRGDAGRDRRAVDVDRRASAS